MAESDELRQRRRAFADAMAGLRLNPRDLARGSAAVSSMRVPIDEVVPGLIETLGSPDADLRSLAAQLLRLQGDAAAVPALLAALQDADENVRFHAIEALGALGAADAVEPCVAIAGGGSWFLAAGALQALADIGRPLDPARLRGHLENRWLRESALMALAATAPESVLEAVAGDAIALLDAGASPTACAKSLITIHARLDARHGGGDACMRLWLRRVATSATLERLVHAAEDSGGDARTSLTRVLTWLSGPQVAAALVRLLPDAERPELLLNALELHQRDAIVPLLTALGGDAPASPIVIAGLGWIGDRTATLPLLDQLRAFPDHAIVIAGALARLRDPRALDALIELLAADDAAVRHAAIGAINAIGAPETESRLQPLLIDARAHVREAAVRIAGYFGFRSCVSALLAACSDAVPGVRLAALECIAVMDHPAVEARLTAARASEDAPTRISAVRGLSAWEAPVATSLLRLALADEDVWVRYSAARALGTRLDESSRTELLELATDDPAAPVRIAAIESAGVPTSAAEHDLLSRVAASDSEPEVRQAARLVLDRHDGGPSDRRRA
jgi:HEAT repeat protein